MNICSHLKNDTVKVRHNLSGHETIDWYRQKTLFATLNRNKGSNFSNNSIELTLFS